MSRFKELFGVFVLVQCAVAEEGQLPWFQLLNNMGQNQQFILNPTDPQQPQGSGDLDQGQLQKSLTSNLDAALPKDAFCSQRTVQGLRSYCLGLKDGDYFDPWNPYCGFIRCDSQQARRQYCGRGTWMGVNSGANLGQIFMCRKPLYISGIKIRENYACPVETDNLEFCAAARGVVKMNDVQQ